MTEDTDGQVSGREAPYVWRGRHPAQGSLVPRCGQVGEALTERSGLPETGLDIRWGSDTDDMADSVFEEMEEVFGFLLGAVWLWAAGGRVIGGRVEGTVMVLEGNEEFEPRNAGSGAYCRGNAEAIEEAGDWDGLNDRGGPLEGLNGSPIEGDEEGSGWGVWPGQGVVNIDVGADCGAKLVDVLVGSPVMLVFAEDGNDEPLHPAGEGLVIGGPLGKVFMYRSHVGMVRKDALGGLVVRLFIS